MVEQIFKHSYRSVLNELARRLGEPKRCLLQVLAGPRQVGKTTLLLALARQFGERALYVSADAPESSLPAWWEGVWARARALAQNGPAYLFVDEVPYVPHWSRRLKTEADELARTSLPLRVVVSGSSALHLGMGTRETMAGRFELLRLLHWSPADLAAQFNMPAEAAVDHWVRWGGYPGAMALRGEPDRWREYIRQSILEPALSRDILLLEPIRKPALLRQLYAVCAGHPAEIVSLQKLAGQLAAGTAMETAAHYLHVLEEAGIAVGLPKYSTREIRLRSAPPKLCVLNHALLNAATSTGCPEPAREPERWGRWIENACLALAWNAGQEVHYWRAEPHEVDLVLTGAWGRWAIEVKTGPFAARDLSGLAEFCRRHPDFRPLVLCDPRGQDAVKNTGIAAQPWRDFLLHGPPAGA